MKINSTIIISFVIDYGAIISSANPTQVEIVYTLSLIIFYYITRLKINIILNGKFRFVNIVRFPFLSHICNL